MANLNKEYYFTDQNIIQKTKCRKKQIILLNTGCSIEEHLVKITNRYNKKYTKIPAFSVGKSGQIYQHFDPANYTQIIDNQELNKQSIVIAVENIGWLTHNEDTNQYFDWRGFAYSEDIIEKQWRLKKYWADYTNEQYLALIELIDYLCIEYSIDKKFVGCNIVINKPNNFHGVLTRSNFSKNHYDLTPAFDFEKLIELTNK